MLSNMPFNVGVYICGLGQISISENTHVFGETVETHR